jgi:hypothetical protein
VREEGCGGRGSGKAQAAKYPEEPSLAQAGPWCHGLRRGSLSKQLHKRARALRLLKRRKRAITSRMGFAMDFGINRTLAI